jgi:hypothetical protein
MLIIFLLLSPNMNKMQELLLHAANELGIRIIVGFIVRLPDDYLLPTEALFPDLGGLNGTIVLNSDYEFDAEVRRSLMAQGFSISAFSEPLQNENFDLDSYAEMFTEWGWTGNECLKPEWMI